MRLFDCIKHRPLAKPRWHVHKRKRINAAYLRDLLYENDARISTGQNKENVCKAHQADVCILDKAFKKMKKVKQKMCVGGGVGLRGREENINKK